MKNKSTTLAREAIAKLVDGNADKLVDWLDEIAADPKLGPHAAWKCMMDVLEYHIPKLARTEITGANGEPFKVHAVDYSTAQLSPAPIPAPRT